MAETSWPPLAVVVPNYAGAGHLEACFGSLSTLDYPADRLELLLVDNGSADDSLAFMRRRFPHVRTVRNRANLGFATACNQGVAAARAPYVALLNNDARVDPAWARELIAPLVRYPTAAAVGARILDWSGERIDYAGGLLNFYGHAFQRLYGAPVGDDVDHTLRPTLFACGCAMVVRRDVFLAAGGFDEAYFAFFEDVDLGWRLWLRGHAVLYAPRAVTYHRGHGTASRVPAHQLRVLYERNALYTIIKNYGAATLARVLPAALLLAAQRGLMTGRVETAAYVLGEEGSGSVESLPRLALSHFIALGEIGLKLDEVWLRRAAVQAARRRPDAAILPLFGEPFMPNLVEPRYLEAQERLVRAFALDSLFQPAPPPALDVTLADLPLPDPPASSLAGSIPRPVSEPASSPGLAPPHPLGGGRGERRRLTTTLSPPVRSAVAPTAEAPVLLVCGDPVGANMAGPAVRCWEMARALACAGLPVRLAVPNADAPAGDGFRVDSYGDRPERLVPLARAASVIVVQGFILHKAPALRALPTPLVVDLYDPFILENLAFFAADRPAFRQTTHAEHLAVLNEQLQAGDFFLCASERQRDYWLGMLAANNRLNPLTYDCDPTLRALVDVVPYGLPLDPPARTRPAVKGVHPGIAANDRLVLWGGGLWDWLDPLTLLRAMVRVAECHADVRLLFLGMRHPNAALPEMAMPRRTRALADELGLANRVVFFLDWVPYAERAAYLIEADVAVSLHPDAVETRYAFRSRLLDYFWAGSPIVCTRGDALAELVEREGLGRVVPPADEAAVAEALLALLERRGLRAELAPHFARVAASHTWDRAVEPLVTYCRAPRRAADAGAAAPSAARRRELPAPAGLPRASAHRGRDAPGTVSAINYVARPTAWWRLPLRAWYVLRRGGPRRLHQEVRGYYRWLRTGHQPAR